MGDEIRQKRSPLVGLIRFFIGMMVGIMERVPPPRALALGMGFMAVTSTRAYVDTNVISYLNAVAAGEWWISFPLALVFGSWLLSMNDVHPVFHFFALIPAALYMVGLFFFQDAGTLAQLASSYLFLAMFVGASGIYWYGKQVHVEAKYRQLEKRTDELVALAVQPPSTPTAD